MESKTLTAAPRVSGAREIKMKTLIAAQAVSFNSRGALLIDAATDGNGPVWTDKLGRDFIKLFCCNRWYDDVIVELTFKNPLFVQSTDSCTDEDAPGARDLIRAAAVSAIEKNDEILLRCAIAHSERLLNASRADGDESHAVTKFIKEQLCKMHLEFDTNTLAAYGSDRYNDVLRQIAASEYTPVAFVKE